MTRTLVLFSLLSLAAACGDNKTTGKTVVLQTKLTSDLTADRTFTTSSGWHVTLDQARFASGALYYYDGEPAFTERAHGTLWRFAERFSPIQAAWAHPGHYVPGNAVGQMSEPFSIDLLGGEVSLPVGRGITGSVRSATFSFAAPTAGPEVAALGGHVVVTTGHASMDGGVTYFQLNGDLAGIERTAKDGQVTGCRFDAAEITGDGVVTITVKPRVWFNLVNFSMIPPGSQAEPTLVDPTSTPHIAFALGLGQLSAYEFKLSP